MTNPNQRLEELRSILNSLRQLLPEFTNELERADQAAKETASGAVENFAVLEAIISRLVQHQRSLADTFASIKERSDLSVNQETLDKSSAVINQINKLVTDASSITEKWGSELRSTAQNISVLSDQATTATNNVNKFTESLRVATQAQTGAKRTELVYVTGGAVSPFSRGLSLDSKQLIDLQREAVSVLETEFRKLGNVVKFDYTNLLDAATGELIIQGEATRKLGENFKEIFTLKAYASPYTGEVSVLPQAQRVFVEQVGGIERAQTVLSQYGITLGHVISVHKDLTSDVTKFNVVGPNGYERATIQVDKFGNAVLIAERNSRTLLRNIERNITKVVEWAAATATVYGIIRSITDAARSMEDIQDIMANISISTGATTDQLNQLYETALNISNLTGTDVTEVLENQQRALRLAAGEADRFGVAEKMLTDATILAKLAGIDQAEAMDTLLGALRQTGLSLTDGTILLDKWVRVSKNAGVSIQDLAQSFATTAAVADTIGVSIDELNALIAVLAENTTLSSTEIGNALRTMMSNITSPEAISTLEEFGISVKDVNGELRSWSDITENIVNLMQAGILNDEQLNKLANALGGGSRRGPQILAIWRNYDQVIRLTEESTNASGDAADALTIKVDTLKSAINELNNAFNDLVKTLGFEGGFLQMVTEGVRAVTELIRTITDLIEPLKESSSAIAVALGSMMLLNRAGGGGPLGAGVVGLTASMTGSARLSQLSRTIGQTEASSLTSSIIQGVIPGLTIAIAEAISAATSQEERNIGNVVARGVAAVAGGVVGALITPGLAPVGAILADSIVAGIQARQEQLREIFTDLGSKTAEEIERVLHETFFSKQLFTREIKVPEGMEEIDAAKLIVEAMDTELFQTLNKIGGAGLGGILTSYMLSGYATTQFEESLGITSEQAELLVNAARTFAPEDLEALKEAIEEYEAAKRREVELLRETTRVFTPRVFMDIQNIVAGRAPGFATTFTELRERTFREAVISGDLEKYNQLTASYERISNVIPQLVVALGNLNISQAEYNNLATTMLYATDEQVGRIVTLTSALIDARAELQKIEDQMRELPASETEISRFLGAEAARQRQEIDRIRNTLREELTLTQRSIKLQQTREGFISPTFLPEGVTRQMIELAVKQAKQAQAEYARFLGLSPALLAQSVTDPLVLAFEDGFLKIEGLTSDFQRIFLDRLKEMVDQAKETLGFSFKDLKDIPVSMAGEIQTRINFYENILRSRFEPFGFKEERQNIGVRFEDNQFRLLHGTATAMQLALEDLIDIEEKQLEGIWNLPEGMTAFVPITSLFYQQQKLLEPLPQLEPVSVDVNPVIEPIHSLETTTKVGLTEVNSNLLRIYSELSRANAERRALNPDGPLKRPSQTTVVNVNLDGRRIYQEVIETQSQEFKKTARTGGSLFPRVQ